MKLRLTILGLFLAFSAWVHGQSLGTPEFRRSVIQAPGTPQPHYYYGTGYVTGRDTIALAPTTDRKPIGVFVVDSGGFKSHHESFWIEDELRRFYPILREGYTVFILCHPDGTDSELPKIGGFRYPVWLAAEIEEYLRQSILAVKIQHRPGNGICQEITKWAITGGSAGGTLALGIGLDNTPLVDLTTNVDTRIDAIYVNSAGINPLSYRFPDDHAWANRTASALVHPDLTSQGPNFPIPIHMTLPSHYPPATQIAFPDPSQMFSTGPGVPNYPRFPEFYLAQSPFGFYLNGGSGYLSEFRLSGNTADSYDDLTIPPVPPATDDGQNQSDPGTITASCASPTAYQALDSTWIGFMTGNLVIDKVDGSDPPVLYRHGDKDYIVHYHQLEEYQAKWVGGSYGWPGLTGPHPPVFLTRAGWGHDWRDLDGEDNARLFIAFMKEELEVPPEFSSYKDSDLDHLPDDLESYPTYAFDPDVDGDGQMDGDELLFHQLWSPGETASTSNWVSSAEETFRITRIDRDVDPNLPANWRLKLEFKGNASVRYEVETCDSLVVYYGVESDPDSARYALEPTWSRLAQNLPDPNFSTGSGGNMTAAFWDAIVGGNRNAQFFRIAAAGGRSATAPVGVLRNVIRRDESASGAETHNFISFPFRTEEVGRYRLLRTQMATAGGTDLLLRVDAPGIPMSQLPATLLSPDPKAVVTETNTDEYMYYAMVERDHSVNRPGTNPDDKGAEGCWWFIEGEVTQSKVVTGVRVKEWTDLTNSVRRALDLVGNTPGTVMAPKNGGAACISIRRLTTLDDIFPGTVVPGSAPTEYRMEDPSNPVAQSPFRVGDHILIAKRTDWSMKWGNPSVQPPMGKIQPRVELACMVETDPVTSQQHYFWVDFLSPLNPSPKVNLEDYRIRPDEGVVYVAVAVAGVAESEFWTHGWVPQSDLVGYVNADNGAATGQYDTVIQGPGGPEHWDSYGVSVMAWPFPADCYLATATGPTTGFFESLPCGVGRPISAPISGLSYPGGQLATFMSMADVASDDYLSGLPRDCSLFYGADDGDYQYWSESVPTVRGLLHDARIPPGALWFNGNTSLTNVGGVTGLDLPARDINIDRFKMRAGRAVTVFTNQPGNGREGDLNRRVAEWKMRRPYRRP